MTWEQIGEAIAKMSADQKRQRAYFGENTDSGRMVPVQLQQATEDLKLAWGDEAKNVRENGFDPEEVVVPVGHYYFD